MITRERSWRLGAAIAAVAAGGAIAAAYFSAFHTLPWMSPDSFSYLNGDVSRTPAYPLLLRVIPLNTLADVQLAALCISTAWLTWELATLVPPLFAITFELLVLGNTQLVAYAFTMLPEAFFVSVEQVQFAYAFRLIRSGRARDAYALGLTTALLILLKPSGYSFVAPLAVLLWWGWRGVRLQAGRAIAALAAAILAASAINAARAGFFGTQAHGGYALVGYVGHLIQANTPTRYPALTQAIADRTARSRSELAAPRPLDAYYIVSSTAYHDVLDTISETILESVHRDQPTLDQRAAAVQMNSIAESLAVSAMLDDPRGYARQVGAHLYGLWFLPLLRNRSEAATFTAELDDLKRTAPFTMRSPLAYRDVPPLMFWPIKLMLVAALIAACAGAVLAIAARTPLTMSLAWCAVALHANFLLVAAVQTGLPRYALAMWPATIATLTLGSWAAVDRLALTGGRTARETTRRDGPSA
jgi:hypothetical protein